MTIRIQRAESGCIAVAIAVLFVLAGYQWWVLLATFLVFDLSMVGYARSPRLGAALYNLVHNHSIPALLAGVYAVGFAHGDPVWILGLLAGCWGFHVAVDRALGYGLKTNQGFRHTHLGVLGGTQSTRGQDLGASSSAT